MRGITTLWYYLKLLRDPIDCARTVVERYGPLVAFESFGFHRRGRTTILAVGSAFNKSVLGDPRIWHAGQLPMSGPKGSALERMTENLVSLNGARHAHYRRLLAQPIRNSSVDGLGDAIGAVVAGEVASWRSGNADIWPLAKDLMRTVAVALLFGGDQQRGAALGEALEAFVLEAKSPKVYLCRAGFPGKAFERVLARADEIERCAFDMAATDRGPKHGIDLVSLIVNSADENGDAPSDRAIAGHLPVLFGASYETCQTILTWTLFLLAQHPCVARDLADEIAGALKGAPPTLSRVKDLPLLDAVFRESTRILPPVPAQSRIASQDTQLGRYEVEAGSHVVLSSFLTNRDPDLYEEPARFKPERWSRINPSAFEYMVFSGGPRICPGYWFGMGVVKVALAAILSRFRIAVVPNARIDYRMSITMRPRNGMPVVLHAPDNEWVASPVTGQIRKLVELGPPRSH